MPAYLTQFDAQFVEFIDAYFQVIYTDVALDPYNSDGHDGIVREDGKFFLWQGEFGIISAG